MPGQNTLIVFLLSVVLAFGAGWTIHKWKAGNEARKDLVKMQEVERQAQRVADDAGASESLTQTELKRKAADSEEQFKQASKDLADCRVNSGVVVVLNDAELSEPSQATRRAQSDAKGAETAWSSCLAELNIARQNYTEVCVPNATQLRDLQRFYKNLRDELNQR